MVRNRLLIGIFIATCAALPAQAAVSQAEAMPLIQQANAANSDCRGGSGDSQATWASCKKRDELYSELNRKGWCWGLPGQAQYEKFWQQCDGGQKGTLATAPSPHKYAVEMDGEYGYEVAPSDIDRAQGIATKPLVMAKYKGIIDGKRVIDIRRPNGIEQYYCTGDCKYLTYMRMTAGFYDKQVIKYDPSTVIGAIVDDMMAGNLKTTKK